MAFSRGKYGVEYHRPVDQETHRVRWLLVGVAVLVIVSFVVARSRRKPGPPTVLPSTVTPVERIVSAGPQPAPPAQAKPAVVQQKPAPVETAKPPSPSVPSVPSRTTRPSPFVSKVDAWISSRTWPKAELELLTLLRDAEQRGNLQGTRGAIESLVFRPPVEDLKDPLIRHLGELNTQLLFSGTNTPWTATVTVKRGDTLQRIASEHRTTLEALQKLNPLKDPNRLALGQKLRVLNFPDADLVVHKQLQFADLLLKKRIFKRYNVTVRKDAEPGAYPVANETGSRASDRLRTLLQQIAPADRDELRLFLAPGSRITVTAQ